MSQSLQLIAELKRQLKLHGKSYQHVAQVLNLSEAGHDGIEMAQLSLIDN